MRKLPRPTALANSTRTMVELAEAQFGLTSERLNPL